MRLTSVDLPTFGRPTTATTGGGARSCSTSSSSRARCGPLTTPPRLPARSRVRSSRVQLVARSMPPRLPARSRVRDSRVRLLARSCAFPYDAQDLGDDLVEAEAGRVELDGVGRGRERAGLTGRVEAVAAGHGVPRRGNAGARQLRVAAPGAYVGARGQEDLHGRLGGDDRADVAALDDDAALSDDLPLQGDEVLPDLRDGGHHAHRGGD